MTSILVFSGTVGYRHPSLEAGVRATIELAEAAGVAVHATESADVFDSSELDSFAAVVWMQTSGTGLLDVAQRRKYGEFTHAGGGFAGVHAASDAERDWPLFDQLVGARFKSHPSELQRVPVRFEDRLDPSAAGLPEPWEWLDEWYTFEDNPRGRVQVLATIAESDYEPGESTMGEDHPIIWRTEVGAAKAWYTALGHRPEAFDDEIFRKHLWGGISSVLRSPAERKD